MVPIAAGATRGIARGMVGGWPAPKECSQRASGKPQHNLRESARAQKKQNRAPRRRRHDVVARRRASSRPWHCAARCFNSLCDGRKRAYMYVHERSSTSSLPEPACPPAPPARRASRRGGSHLRRRAATCRKRLGLRTSGDVRERQRRGSQQRTGGALSALMQCLWACAALKEAGWRVGGGATPGGRDRAGEARPASVDPSSVAAVRGERRRARSAHRRPP